MDTDPQYTEAQNHQTMIDVGKISFRTCAHIVHLSGSHILKLVHASYPAVSISGEPHSFTEAFDHWFLCKILNGIGGYSML